MNFRKYILFYSIASFFLLLFSLLWCSISDDSAYYLCIARDISRGLVPYKDISNVYTPVMMYWNSLLFFFMEEFYYPAFLGFQYIVIMTCSFWLYKITTVFLGLEKAKSFLLCLFFVIATWSSDGTYINLEVYVIFFVFCSLWNFFKKNYTLTGLFLGISFFCKQYGLFHFIPFYFFILFYEEKKWNNSLRLSMGGLIPLIVFLVYYVCYQSLDIKTLIHQITGQGIMKYYSRADENYLSLIWGGKVFFLLLLPVLLQSRFIFRDKIQKFCFFGMIINLLPAFVQSFQHYFLLAFPYLFLILASTHFQTKIEKIFWRILHICIILIILLLALRLYRYRGLSEEQNFFAEQIAKQIPKKSTVFLDGWIRYLYLKNEYKNPLLQQTGYSFVYSLDPEWQKKFPILSSEKQDGLEIKKQIFLRNKVIYLYRDEK